MTLEEIDYSSTHHHRDYKSLLASIMHCRGVDAFDYEITHYETKNEAALVEAALVESIQPFCNQQGGGVRGYKRSYATRMKSASRGMSMRVIYNGEHYCSISEAARQNNCSYDKVKYRIDSENYKESRFA